MPIIDSMRTYGTEWLGARAAPCAESARSPSPPVRGSVRPPADCNSCVLRAGGRQRAANRPRMHNRALHDSLAAFVEEAAWQLAEEVVGRRRDPVRARRDADRASAPLYCYRPLTGRFIAQRIGDARAGCRPIPRPRSGLAALPDLPAYLRAAAAACPPGDARALADAALQAFLGAVWADATDFVFDAERFEAAYARARGGRLRRLRALAS